MRTMLRCLATAALLAAVAACGSDDSSGSSVVTSATSAPSTQAPTTVPTTSPSGTTTVVPSTASTTVPLAELNSKLLAVSDLPAGWKLASPINEADLSDSWQAPCDDVALNPTIRDRLKAVTGIQFEPADGSYKFLIEFVSTGEATRLARDIEAYIGAFQSCSTTGQNPPTITELALPALGDQRAAFTILAAETAESESVWYGRTAIVRIGRVAIAIGMIEVVPTASPKPTITDAQYVSIVEAAAKRFTATS